MTRIYLPFELTSNTQLALPDSARRHVVQVLRMKAGEQLTVFDGSGQEASATLIKAEKKEAVVAVDTLYSPEVEAKRQVHLGYAMARGEKMDLVIQKTTELGVHAITPLITEHSQVKIPAQKIEKRLQHWQGVAISACEQSGRVRIPYVAKPNKLTEWINSVNAKQKFIFHPGKEKSLDEVKLAESVALLVGPEGGFSEEEVRAAVNAGFEVLSMGPRILRTETAGIVSVGLVSS